MRTASAAQETEAMELRHLRYFVAVAEELHFRRAAERLHVAQPAVSEQIRKLEAELGVQLFERTQRSVTLTPAGSAMLEESRRVLRQAETARTAACEAHGRALAALRIGYLPDVLPPALPRLLRRFAAAVPGVRVTLECGATRPLLEAVREGRLDLAAICLPAPINGLRVVPIANEAIVAAVPEDHACAGARALDLGALQHTRLVTLARAVNPSFYDGVLAAFRAAGVAPALLDVAEPTLEQVLLSVASGAGIALLPSSAESRLTTPGVRFTPLAPPVPEYTVALLARRELPPPAAALLRLAAGARSRPRPLAVAA
jgi:DNA-binding transcriptional LysR family regulator